MAEIRLETAKMQEIRDQIPEMSATIKKNMAALVSSLENIKKNIDSDGINTILSKFNESISELQNDLIGNLDTAYNYLGNKFAGYSKVTNSFNEQSNKVNAALEELEKEY